ncbi:MAG: UDP-N-acetylmuramoyl-L-alanyl-D-glutamate--2,6-diaminopimelate ligase [Bacteroidia bacterium]|nr:UDP-N-acetylmuramoyl-L-alanyl-D-glutamate--2,6-diaminopimelate ligase [Bacteroidia bacterium]MCZ2249389.1 UDP-N-acetylmuramoyl-L-alanyl-D-glutamate--2,6-diaminopimelate ligase [Bacteroidia bacterium]
MKVLSDILYKTGIEELIGSTLMEVDNICFDSRNVTKNSVFVAIVGVNSDGHLFIDKAIEKGATAVVCHHFPENINQSVTYIKVKDSALALSIMACNFFDNPSSKLKLVGVTGTNGKTTTVTLLYKLFKELGYKTGLISTVKNYINDFEVEATHTTPEPIQLNSLLTRMVESGVTHCFMEVSSHSIVQHRVSGLQFAGGAFSNITHDHLDYHKTFDNYLAAKKGFFDMLPATAFAIANKDDRHYAVMLQNTRAVKKTCSLGKPADFKGKIIENNFEGLDLVIEGTEFFSKLIGHFNAQNILMVYAIAIMLNEDKTNVLTALSNLNPVDGRFQFIRSTNKITGIVDYAHTPDALTNVLKTIQDIRSGKENIITVVGCGGNRDAAKRPLMAEIACKWSNRVIITSDNPRNEEPDEIINQMMQGVDIINKRKVLCINDRKEAIKAACALANTGDIILIAGKGHEKYQEIKGVKYPFDDMKELSEQFQLINNN